MLYFQPKSVTDDRGRRMKILLTAINAKFIHSNLAVYSLRSFAKECRQWIEVAEYTINQQSGAVLREIYRKMPDVLCFSCYIWNYEMVREIAADFHKLRPDVPIWVGGPEVSFEAEGTLAQNPAFFGVMMGEGEASFAKLARHYCLGEGSLSEISGISYRGSDGEGGFFGTDEGMRRICRTAAGEPLPMDSIPFCYEDMADYKHRIVYYESSRGCPFSCSYCLSSIDKRLRFRSLGLVRKELSFFIEKEVAQVKFVDRTFNCDRRRALAIWQFIQEQDRGKTNFHFEIAADLLGEEELLLLSTLRPGLVQLEIGVQSTNPETLAEIRRTMDMPKVASAVRRIQAAHNIHVHLDLIAGLPFEGYGRFAESFRDIYALQPNQLQLGFLKVLKGSYLYKRHKEYGILFQEKPPYEVLRTDWLSFEEMDAIKLVEEMLEVYYNSGQFEVTMKLLGAVYPDAFSFFLALGRHYENGGYFGRSHSRMRRCEILLEFLTEDGAAPRDLMEEALLYDLYYRENMKSRPSWARDLAAFANVAKAFCVSKSQMHMEPFSYHFPKTGERALMRLPEKQSELAYVLFDYRERDALTHQAKVTEFTEREVRVRCENVQKKF